MTSATLIEELQAIHNDLVRSSAVLSAPEFTRPLAALEENANEVGKAWSGSWLGYQSRVYYKNLQPPPAGAHFSIEWGFDGVFEPETRGEWQEFAAGFIEQAIVEGASASSPDKDECQKLSEKQRLLVNEKRNEMASILRASQRMYDDSFLGKLIEETEGTKSLQNSITLNISNPLGT